MAINFADVRKFEISVSSGKQYRELSYLYFNGTDNIISTPDTMGSSVYTCREITLSDIGELNQVSGIFFFATAGLYQYAVAGMYIGGGGGDPYLRAKACFDYEGSHYLDNPLYIGVMNESNFSNICSAKNRYVLYVEDNEDPNTNTLYPYTATSCVYDSSGTLLTSASDNIVENTISSPSAGAFKLMATTDGYGSTVHALNAKLYSYIVKSSVDGSITIDMVPAQRKSDSAYGMYDKIGGTFYPISGTTTSSTPGAIVDENPSWSPSNTPTILEVKKIQNANNVVLWSKGLYRQLEYIQSTGTQAIDTTAKPARNSYMKLIIEDMDSTLASQQMGRGAVANNQRFAAGYSSGAPFFGIGKEWITRVPISSGKHTLGVQGPECMVLGSGQGYSIDGSFTSNSAQFPSGITWYSVYILGSRGDSSGSIQGAVKCKLYYAEIGYTNTNTQAQNYNRKLYPVQRKSDGKLGFYDTVSGTFFCDLVTGSDSGTLVAGPIYEECFDPDNATLPS